MCAEQHRLPSACSDSLTDRDVHRGEQLVLGRKGLRLRYFRPPAVSNGAGDQIGGHRALIGRLEPAGYDSGHIRLRLRGPTIATYGVRGGSFRARCPDSGLVQSDGDRRPSRSTDGAVDILASFPPVRGLVFGSTACGGSREVGVLLTQAQGSGRVVVSPASDVALTWRPLHARRAVLHDLDAALPGLSQVGFAAAVAHARLRLSRLELIGGSGRTAGRYASAARAFISPTAFKQARGGALGTERVEAGSGSLGAASSESAAGSGRLRACGC